MKLPALIIFIFSFFSIYCKGNVNDTLIKVYSRRSNELFISYGMFAFNSVFTGFRLSSTGLPYDYRIHDYNYKKKLTEIPPVLGVLNIGYKRYIKNKYSVIINISYTQNNNKFINTIYDSLGFTSKDFTLSTLVGFEYHYLNKKYLNLYSGVQLGMYHTRLILLENKSKTSNSKTGFAFQVDAFGLCVGKNVFGFIELGFGFNGIIKFGISGRF